MAEPLLSLAAIPYFGPDCISDGILYVPAPGDRLNLFALRRFSCPKPHFADPGVVKSSFGLYRPGSC